MNTEETIAAAIEKLGTLSQHASVAIMFLPLKDDPIEYDLGTTLYRTIPALLGLLRVAVNNPGCETDEEVALANAILGEPRDPE